MKIYKALRKGGQIKIFTPPAGSSKPAGVYFAPTREIAQRWGENLYRGEEFEVIELDIPGTVFVYAARDGWYWQAGFAKMCKYFAGPLHEAVRHAMKPLYWWGGHEIWRNDRALPEVIIPPKVWEEVAKGIFL